MPAMAIRQRLVLRSTMLLRGDCADFDDHLGTRSSDSDSQAGWFVDQRHSGDVSATRRKYVRNLDQKESSRREVRLLGTFGLDDLEQTTYLALLRLPASDENELAERLARPAEEITMALDRLVKEGFIRRAGDRLVAVQPDVAFGPDLLRRHGEIQRVQTFVATLMEEYRERSSLRDAREVVEVVVGAAEVMARWQYLQNTAQKEVKGLIKEPIVFSTENQAQQMAMAAGVVYRTVYERTIIDVAGDPYRLAWWAANGESIRIATDVPTKLMILDGRTAFLPSMSASAEPAALVITSGALLDVLNWVFETVWEAAVPFPASEDTLSPEDRRLLSLIIAGYTDLAIGKQFGLSHRTVQRRVSQLVRLAGVETRLQLIWHAAKHDWL
ncbi:helix-turn-helix domain-containing protein [Nonomuraea insulae]|uniref:Helix-turn-helix domain-containing protein n=1 Tax=Nonomuraea insulae TaxID=1616787 RepID=A0ABW1CRZ0_9ACTN